MASNLVIKVAADTKDAADKLRKLGYNVEEVKKSTDKATHATSTWDKALEKASKDNIKNLVNLGAKFLTVSTAATLAYKGIKSIVDEALKGNSEAKKQLDSINTAWDGVKANLGGALLDSITPALSWLEEELDRLWKKTEEMKKEKETANLAQYLYSSRTSKTTAEDYASAYSLEQLEALDQYLMSNNMGKGQGDFQALVNQAYRLSYMDKLKGTGKYGNNDVDTTRSSNYSQNKDHFDKLIREEQERQAQIAYEQLTLKWNTEGEMLGAKQAELQAEAEAEEQALAERSARYDQLIEEENERNEKLAEEQMKLRQSNEAQMRAEELEALEEEARRLEERKELYKSFYSDIAGYAVQGFSAINSAMDTHYNNEIARIKESMNSEEDKARQIDEVRKRQFESEKANSISQALIDTASGIMNIWSKYAENPIMAGILTGLLTGTSATQIGAIAAEKYTGLASGGIVSSPTHALIGEGADKEAVIPLSKLEDFVAPPDQRGAIVININMTDGGSRKDIAEEVYYAIERAQRTGLLPRWKYA